MIIADESHKIKSFRTATSKAMHRLGAKAEYRLLLTGTLVTNHAEDVFSPYKFLNPIIFGNSYFSWRSRYFDSYGYGGYQYRLKKTRESEFLRKVHSIAFRCRKEDCLDLPETTDIIRYVEAVKRLLAKMGFVYALVDGSTKNRSEEVRRFQEEADICCEQLGRICYAIELDEKFVDVIVNRYIEIVGSADGVFVERDGSSIPYTEVVAYG